MCLIDVTRITKNDKRRNETVKCYKIVYKHYGIHGINNYNNIYGCKYWSFKLGKTYHDTETNKIFWYNSRDDEGVYKTGFHAYLSIEAAIRGQKTSAFRQGRKSPHTGNIDPVVIVECKITNITAIGKQHIESDENSAICGRTLTLVKEVK